MEEVRNDNNVRPPQQPQADEIENQKWLENMRGSLMVVATVIASITYQAGLNPPGGVWQDNKDNPPKHVAGEAIAEYETRTRHRGFMIFNNVSFALSLATILVLMRQRVYNSKITMQVLKLQMIGSIMALTLAYARGCPSLGDEYRRLFIPLMVLWGLLSSELLVLLSYHPLARRWCDLNRIRNLIRPSVILSLKVAVFATTIAIRRFYMNLRIQASLVIVNILMGFGCFLWWLDIIKDPERC